MPRIRYEVGRLQRKTQVLLEQMNEVIEEYMEAMSLRQLFYQLVARLIVENTGRNYRRVQECCRRARMLGLMDWDAIEDRGRILHSPSTWDSPAEILHAVANQFRYDAWENQKYRPEVWIEKKALIGSIKRVCEELRVPYIALGGFSSTSTAWDAGYNRFQGYLEQQPVVIYLGDHDPSGLHMSDELGERLNTFAERHVDLRRIALSRDQITQYNLPPNFAKEKDPRYPAYKREHGEDCWELDALPPDVIASLTRDAIEELRDEALWDQVMEREQEVRSDLRGVAEEWE